MNKKMNLYKCIFWGFGRSIILSGRILIPKIETTKESIEERQHAFLKGYKELVRLLDSLYDELLTTSDSRDVTSKLFNQVTEQQVENVPKTDSVQRPVVQKVVQRVKQQFNQPKQKNKKNKKNKRK